VFVIASNLHDLIYLVIHNEFRRRDTTGFAACTSMLVQLKLPGVTVPQNDSVNLSVNVIIQINYTQRA